MHLGLVIRIGRERRAASLHDCMDGNYLTYHEVVVIFYKVVLNRYCGRRQGGLESIPRGLRGMGSLCFVCPSSRYPQLGTLSSCHLGMPPSPSQRRRTQLLHLFCEYLAFLRQ